MTVRSVAIGEIAVLNPKQPELLSDDDITVPFLPMAAVRADGDAPNEQRRRLADLTSGYTYFEKGDVLLAKITPCFENGKVAHLGSLSHPFGFGSTEFHVLKAGPDVDPRYLYHAVRNPRFRRAGASSMTGSAGQRRVPATFVARHRIPLPPLSEQQRIAAMLDKADAVQRKQRERIRLLDELLRSAFLEMFGDPINHLRIRGLPAGWELVTVESIAARTTNACAGGPFGSSLTRADYIATAGVPVIRGTNLVADRAIFREEGFVFVTAEKAKELRRNVARPGDIVFTQRGTLGQVARIPLDAKYPRYIVSQSQMKVTLDETVVDPTYLVHYFLSTHARADLEARTLTTGVPHINLSILKRFPVVLPPLALQRRFAALASRFTICRRHMESARSDADKLANSLTQRAFSGDRTNVSHSIVIPLKTEA